ncbi:MULTISPECIES: response regulator transcription factor [Nocardiopsis]|uniref:Sensory transduction protein RegX3 n=2 Tax=Nocardiopsis alba TaxID=53437 RepID=A0A7K2IQH0_9ACTN|nr:MULTISPECIES: response regulator transcription factor [Nocardiopsis]AFR06871.1 two-component system, regulatory protein [Nocardiopsis alba ATCC BAA-2165]MEC3892865.1 response regulator transcription factor [Nocardiopsis sp. LDBS1602]MYR32222.1 response regulator [Nocardiopsis alba]
MIKVLLVEDDVRLADALAGALEAHGYEVDQVRTGASALAAPPADVVLLDLGLPDMDGIELCRLLRERQDFGDTAVIMVTARGRQRDRVLGLRSGADDYVVKPLGIEELCARMEAVLRRTRKRVDTTLEAGPVRVDLITRTVECEGRPVELTRKEFDLLVVLLRDAGAVVSREHLLLRVWQTAWPGTLRTLEVHIGTLRSKLGVPRLIQTVRGVGYRLGSAGGPHGGRPVAASARASRS